MGIVSCIGHWLDTRFPEKISADEVYRRISAVEFELARVTALEEQFKATASVLQQQAESLAMLSKKLEVLTSENTALKAQAAMRMRMGPVPIPGR